MSRKQYSVESFHSEFVAADSCDIARVVGLLAVDPFPPSRAVYAYRNPSPANTRGIKSLTAGRVSRISCDGFEYVGRFDRFCLNSVLDLAFKHSVVERVVVGVAEISPQITGVAEVNYLIYVNAPKKN
jgi:hypothetical protein